MPLSTGAGMNPARALGPAIAANNLDKMWVFNTAPYLAGIFKFIFLLKFKQRNNSCIHLQNSSSLVLYPRRKYNIRY